MPGTSNAASSVEAFPRWSAGTVLDWYREQPSSPEHVPGTERPYPGVLEVIRWFQLQSSTFVGLNTSRPERLRADTLRSLNALGRDLRVEFDRDLLHMNESGDRG